MAKLEPAELQTPREIVLASTSVYRRAQLERLGLPIRCRSPLFDEERFKDGSRSPRKLAVELARRKASSLSTVELPKTIVIGGDQLLAIDGEAIGKSGSRTAAIAQLRRLSGRTHELLTAIAVTHQGQLHEHLDVTRLTMRSLSVDEIERYVDHDEPWDCAGSYKIERQGIALFESVESADQTAIMGLPMIALVAILRGLGVRLP